MRVDISFGSINPNGDPANPATAVLPDGILYQEFTIEILDPCITVPTAFSAQGDCKDISTTVLRHP